MPYFLSPKVIFGKGALKRLGPEIEQKGDRAVIITDKNMVKYSDKIVEIFKEANIHSIAVVVMEVPCCSALPMIVKQGMEKAGKKIPLEQIVISARGEVLKREKQAA